MDRICWNCKYFVHDDSGGLYPSGGYCKRYSPSGHDVNGFTAHRRYDQLQCGLINATIYKAADSPLALFMGGATADLPTTAAAAGYNSNTVWPHKISPGWVIHRIDLTFSLANTGAATIGANPICQVGMYSVGATGRTLDNTFDVPVPASYVNAESTVVDKFGGGSISNLSPAGAEIAASQFGGFCILLTDDNEDYIGEIRNPMLAITILRTASSIYPYSFPYLQQGNTMQCGDFVLNNGTIPALP